MIKPTYVNPSRRDLIKKLIALGAITLTGPLATQMLVSCDSKKPKDKLLNGVWKEESNYESLRKSMIQASNVSKRYPDIIVSPKTETEMLECLKFAKENNLQIVCRSSGHNNAHCVLRNGGMLMNISAFNNFSIDPVKKELTVQPSAKFEDVVPELTKHQLGFPFADCGKVTFGGYILGGGLGTNGNNYNKGPACYALISADVILENGNKVTVNKDDYSDIFWAIRGCGPAFFGIITSYTLQLFDPIGAKVTKDYTFPLDMLESKIDFLDKRMQSKDDRVVTRINLVGSADNNELQIEIAISCLTLQSDTALKDAQQLVQYYIDEGIGENALSESGTQSEDVDFYFFNYPPNFRTNTDNAYTDDSKAFLSIIEHYRNKPDCMITMGLVHYAQMHPFREDSCYSPQGKHFINYHVNWMDESQDKAAEDWLKKTEAIFKPFKSGHYINQTDNATFPDHIEACFTKENWQKLKQVRTKYDPNSVFYSYLGQA